MKDCSGHGRDVVPTAIPQFALGHNSTGQGAVFDGSQYYNMLYYMI